MDLERWPACHAKDINRSNYPRLRNAVDMNLSMGNTGSGDRYTTAATALGGYPAGTLDYLFKGKANIEEGQHYLAAGVRSDRRSPSPVNIRLQTVRDHALPRPAGGINNSCDSPDFTPETAYRFTKPRFITYTIDKTGRGAPSVGQTQKLAASPSPRSADGQHPADTPKEGDGSGDYKSGTPSPTPKKVKRRAKPPRDIETTDATGTATQSPDQPGKEGGAAAPANNDAEENDQCPIANRRDYESMLKNVNSIQDYYAIVKLWDIKREQQKRLERQLAGKLTPEEHAKANMTSEERTTTQAYRSGTGENPRMQDFSTSRWKGADGDDTRHRLHKKAAGHDFSVSAGRRSPLFWLTLNDKYRTCPWKHLDDTAGGERSEAASTQPPRPATTSPTRSGTTYSRLSSAPSGPSAVMRGGGAKVSSRDAKQPMGRQSRRSMFSPSKKIDMAQILKSQKSKKNVRPRIPIVSTEPLDWTHPEYWNSPAAAEAGGPISVLDDFHLNPVLLSRNVTSRIPPPPLAVMSGRDSRLLGSGKERRKLLLALKEGGMSAEEILTTPLDPPPKPDPPQRSASTT
eukprot:TRINITY_DN25185_c0_g1_i1.p1 TRINITY_DN25185_c0_g1~~TRINITY_DN25185_c0_g1_i1.p1  ORF type:complete len:600 (+),score=193.03 TRINITY_DN25185_c0_g1_i1:85-1800(+)